MVFSVFVQNEPFSIVLALVIFGSYLVIDAGYSYYTLSILKRRPFAAAATGSMMCCSPSECSAIRRTGCISSR